jgi:hypothetical protein
MPGWAWGAWGAGTGAGTTTCCAALAAGCCAWQTVVGTTHATKSRALKKIKYKLRNFPIFIIASSKDKEYYNAIRRSFYLIFDM